MLKDKVVIVTGGAGLIGQEFVRAVVEQRGVAIIADLDRERSLKLQKEISDKYGFKSADFFPLDICSRDSVVRLVEYLEDRYGRIDAVVNNAYPRTKSYGKHFFDVTYKDFCENLNLNIGGYFLVSQVIASYFQRQGYGNIVNIASIYGVMAPKFEIYQDTSMTTPVEYAAIKAAIIHLTKYMAAYFKGMKIRVNTLSPGGVLDGQPQPFLDAYLKKSLNKGMLDPRDLQGTLLYLLSDSSLHVNGQNIVVDDGFSL